MFDEVFCKSLCKKGVSRFFKKEEQFTDSAVVLNRTKRDVLKLQQQFGNTVYFFQGANSRTLNTVCINNRLSR